MTTKQLVREIETLVIDRWGIDHATLLSRTRKPLVDEARRVIYFLARNRGLSFRDVAAPLNRTHGTVLKGCKRVRDHMDTEPGFRTLVEALREKCAQALNNGERKHENQS